MLSVNASPTSAELVVINDAVTKAKRYQKAIEGLKHKNCIDYLDNKGPFKAKTQAYLNTGATPEDLKEILSGLRRIEVGLTEEQEAKILKHFVRNSEAKVERYSEKNISEARATKEEFTEAALIFKTVFFKLYAEKESKDQWRELRAGKKKEDATEELGVVKPRVLGAVKHASIERDTIIKHRELVLSTLQKNGVTNEKVLGKYRNLQPKTKID